MSFEIVEINLDLILLNDTNPRGFIDQDVVNTLALSMAADGQKTEIKVRRQDNNQYWVVGGDHRVLAARKLGWTTIRTTVLDITPDQAYLEGYLDNQGKEMGWFADYKAIEALWNQTDHSKGTQKAVADRLMKSEATVSAALKLMPLLNASSRQLILRQSKNAGGYQLTQRAIYHLTDLSTGQPDDQIRVEATLKVLIALKLVDAKSKDLVAWVKAGNPADTFTGHKTPKAPKPEPVPGIPPEAIDELVEIGRQIGLAEGRGEDPTPAQDKLKVFRESLTSASQSQSPAQEPSHPIFSPEGFALLKQKVGGTFQTFLKKDAAKVESHAEKEAHANGNINAPLTQPNHVSRLVVSTQAKNLKWFEKTAHWFVKIVWHWFIKNEHKVCKKLAHAIVPLHSSSHSGQTHSGHSHQRSGSLTQGLITLFLTLLHWVVYTLCQFVFWWTLVMALTSHFAPNLKPWFEWPFRFTARLALVDFPVWVWAWGSSHLVPALVIGGLLFIGGYYASQKQPARMTLLGLFIFLFIYYGRGWSEEITPSANGNNEPLAQSSPVSPLSGTGQHVASTQMPSPILPKVEAAVAHLIPKKEIEKPAVSPAGTSPTASAVGDPLAGTGRSSPSYIPSVQWSAAQEDPKILELEIAAVRPNSVVKNFPVTPDESMPGDLAGTRMQGVMDPDKYTMMIGSGKQKILSINANTTTLTVNYKSTDPFGTLWGNGGPVNIVWEDVTSIHINEIDRPSPQSGTQQPNIIYQFSLVASGAKYPLTIQCSSTEDLQHLVSTMEYFIRNSRLGRDTALTGMPYPLRGLRLNGECAVEKLWADSPADRAELQLGDHLWSIGKATKDQQEKKDFEKVLQSSLPVTLYVASPADWNKAKIAAGVGSNDIHPKLRKATLNL